MRNRTLAIDLLIAAVATIVLVIVAPGLAIVGLVALLVLIVCGLSYLVDAWRLRRRRPSPAQRSPDRARPRNARGLR